MKCRTIQLKNTIYHDLTGRSEFDWPYPSLFTCICYMLDNIVIDLTFTQCVGWWFPLPVRSTRHSGIDNKSISRFATEVTWLSWVGETISEIQIPLQSLTSNHFWLKKLKTIHYFGFFNTVFLENKLVHISEFYF